MTTPITAPMVPLGPDLAPGKTEPTGIEGFAALLGELVTMVAGPPAGSTPMGTGQQAESAPVPELLPEAAAVACAVAGLVPPVALAAPAAAAGSGTTAVGGPPTESGPEPANPVARAAVLRQGPVEVPPGKAAAPGPEANPAVLSAIAQRAALPVPAQQAPGQLPAAAPAPAVPVEDSAEPPAVPASVPVEATTPAAPATPLPPTASERAVERTESVRPAIVEAARGLRQEGDGRVSLVVRLNPPELGSVLVKLTVQDGRVDVQLRTPDLQAVGDLTAQSREVQQVLKEQGFDLSSFDVTHGGVQDERGERKTPDRGTTQRDERSDGRAEDPRVTDDVPEARAAGTWL